MVYEILEAPKSEAPTEDLLRRALAKEKPGFAVENISGNETTWTIRLAEVPDFLKKKDDDADSSDTSDSAPDSADDDAADDDDTSDESDSDSDSKGKSKGSKNPSAEVKRVIDQLTSLFTELGGHVEELQAAHDEKDQKLKDISDTANEGAPGPGDDGDVGPTPGSPPGAPKPPMPSPAMDRRKPGVPPTPGGGLPAFTNYQVATHPGVNEMGERMSLTAAATALEFDPEFAGYEVVGMTENHDGTFSAKLKRKDV